MYEMNKIYASGLIYGRTYYRDYESKFLLKPLDFSDEDVNWARKYILSAVSYCDELKGMRRVVFGNEKYLVIGVAGILSNLFRMYMPDNEKNQYVLDGNRRNIKCFLGFVCSMKDKKPGEILQLKGVDYLNLFLNHIANDDVWFNKEPLDLRDRNGCDLKCVTACSKDNCRKIDNVMVSSEEWDQEVFEHTLAEIHERNLISLCTNMYNKRMIDESPFRYVTADQYVVKRCLEKSSTKEEKDHISKYEESEGSKKKFISEFGSITRGVLGLLLVVLIVVLVVSFII